MEGPKTRHFNIDWSLIEDARDQSEQASQSSNFPCEFDCVEV